MVSGPGVCEPAMFESTGLEAYLTATIDGFAGPVTAKKFTTGQSNPTFLLATESGKYVLRQKPPGNLLKSAHAVDREFRIQRALAATDVPVARMLHLCEDETVIGSVFYVMEFMDGRIFWDPALPDMTADARGRVYDEMNRVLATIHEVDVEAVGLGDYGRPGDYFARQLSRWTGQYRLSETESITEMDQLIAWLEANLPADDGLVGIVHGDYRIDNLLFHPVEPRVIAVFDWELSTLGHPFADLSYQIMQRSMGRDWHIKGLAGLDTKALGIPAAADYIEAYCRRRNLDVPAHWRFYEAFSFFRFAAICQGVKKRALDGNASSGEAIEVGAMAGPLAVLGWRTAERAPYSPFRSGGIT